MKHNYRLSSDAMVGSTERYGNRRQQIERLVSAWNHGSNEDAALANKPDDPHIAASAEPKRRPRTRLTNEEVETMRTDRSNGISVAALARKYRIHRATVWAKLR